MGRLLGEDRGPNVGGDLTAGVRLEGPRFVILAKRDDKLARIW